MRCVSSTVRARFDANFVVERDFDAEALIFTHVPAPLKAIIRFLFEECDAVVAGPFVLAACCLGGRWPRMMPTLFLTIKAPDWFLLLRNRFELTAVILAPRRHFAFESALRFYIVDYYFDVYFSHDRFDNVSNFSISVYNSYVFRRERRAHFRVSAAGDIFSRRLHMDTRHFARHETICGHVLEPMRDDICDAARLCARDFVVDASHVRDLMSFCRSLEVYNDLDEARAHPITRAFHPKYVVDLCDERFVDARLIKRVDGFDQLFKKFRAIARLDQPR